ncbi:hypothetical protein BLD25_00765 [Candidatus Gracilibacteria bacterium GN02-872]|nr:hypothetical protein BLD25_00765 [Candidatus Gracilibacteria bacterium GN02-872]
MKKIIITLTIVLLSSCGNNGINQEKTNSSSTNSGQEKVETNSEKTGENTNSGKVESSINSGNLNIGTENKSENIKEMCQSVNKGDSFESVVKKIGKGKLASDSGDTQTYVYGSDYSESCRIMIMEGKVYTKLYYNNN